MFIAWLVTGFIVGLVTIMLTRKSVPVDSLATVALGISGAIIGGLLGRMMNAPLGFLGAVVGAMLLLSAFIWTAKKGAWG